MLSEREKLMLDKIYNLIRIIEERLDIVIEMKNTIDCISDKDLRLEKLNMLLNINNKL